MEIDIIMEKYLFRKKDDKKRDGRGKPAHMLIQRYKQAKDLEEKINICFLSNIFVAGLITNDQSLLSKAKIKLQKKS